MVFRDRALSKTYIPDQLINLINNKQISDNGIFITATDGELYGLRHIDHSAEFEKLLKNKNLKTQTISEFIDGNNLVEEIKIIECSWESTEEELKKRNPYALWNDKKNKIQQKIRLRFNCKRQWQKI